MKLFRAGKNRFVFHLGKREQRLLFDTLQLYPLVPPAHHGIGKTAPSPATDEMQQLLDEALAEDRRDNRKRVLAMLNEPQRFNETSRGFELTLTRTQMEWFLQVLNDVRVGSWLALGEPEPEETPVLNEKTAPYLLAMQVCGLFQSMLLEALGVEQSPQWE